MPSPAVAFATALGVVFLAEFGDKSQVLLLARAAHHPARRVLGEAVLAFALLAALAVTVGALLARLVPGLLLGIASGVLFVVFGLLALREATAKGQDDEAKDDDVRPTRFGGTFGLVVVSEMGDKTQLATAALAASGGHILATGLGSWLAESLSAVLAVAAGSWLAGRVSRRRGAALSAVLFLALGLLTLGYAAWQAFA